MQLLIEIFGNIFIQTWLGALCGHLLSLYSDDFKGTVPFIKKLIPNKSDTLYFRIDFIILPLIGALMAFVLLDPATLKSSIFAGLSWSGTLMAMLKRNQKNIEADNEQH